ncbi:MAG TPA: hypothetical protein VJO99_10610 [Burkholderiaceae bacterium]|nr:hypothetical protein [Burkholderiaceae bacterium]
MRTPNYSLVAAACLLALGGCAASASPEWDARFGESNRMLAAQQVLDPAAPTRNAQKVAPTDGRTAREATNRHVDTYRSPPPTSIINIGVGAGGNGR